MHEQQTTRRPGEVVFTIFLLVGSLVLLWQAYGISGFSALSSAGAFPMAMSAIMVVSLAIILAKTLRKPAPAAVLERLRAEILPATVVVFCGLILVYSLILDWLGFIPASFLFLLTAITFLQGGRFKRALGLSLLSILCVYVVFRLVFQVVLPEGLIPERAIIAWIQSFFATGT
ncbi:tripartite tricarboxylate transporter TctB family protein [Allorhizobium pseudoryzae]|uniref:tripartite tricarboxylate transporter TctB family protein n=1 Tax=Allorhizobium pseudoryzae TaxID=379684 RepID=UPI003D022E61